MRTVAWTFMGRVSRAKNHNTSQIGQTAAGPGASRNAGKARLESGVPARVDGSEGVAIAFHKRSTAAGADRFMRLLARCASKAGL